jgi:hypothetical protein
MPTINRGDDYFQVVTYTGNGSTNTITGLRFKPDYVWIKGRSGATDHALYDSVRGTTKDLVSNSTAAETTQSTGLTSFNSDGFTLGALSKVNTNGATYVAWCWKASGTTSSNTNGSITSTVSVNASAGFSVVTYTGTGANATVGHGLGVAPRMIIAKRRTSTGVQWLIYHASLTTPTTAALFFTTAAQSNSATYWNSTQPTSTVFSVGTDSSINVASGDTFVAYCWAEIAGFSKFGSYTGNGSADGPFVFTGFLPKFVMIKNASAVADWYMLDSARNTYNVTNLFLYPNLSNAEATGSAGLYELDFLSNGFKIRGNAANLNGSTNTIIYMAFAESPFRNSLAR